MHTPERGATGDILKGLMRVTMIIHGYHPWVGGAERQMGALAPVLKAQGMDVHVLTRRFRGLAPFEMIEGIPVHRLPIPGPKVTASLSFTMHGLLLLRRLRPQVIHAHELFSATTTAVAAKRLLGTPVVVTVHGGGGHLNEIERLKRASLGWRRLDMFCQQVDAFVVISQEIDSKLAELGVPPERRVPIPNGVDVERFRPLSPTDKKALRASLDLDDGLIVIYTGRLAPEKCLDTLLSVWPAVRCSCPDARLVLLGTGPEEKALRGMATEGVHFAGRVEDVAPYVQTADLFVLPSAAEGLSVALLEAMASELPVVVTAVGGTTDVIEHGSNGWLVPPGDAPALGQALVHLLTDADERTRLGRMARQCVVREYALPNVAARLGELYELLVRRQPVVSLC